MVRRTTGTLPLLGALLASLPAGAHAGDLANWLGTSMQALKGVVTAVAGEKYSAGLDQCGDLPDIIEKIGSSEDCPQSNSNNVQLTLWMLKKFGISAALGDEGTAIWSDDSEDKRMRKVFHNRMEEACQKPKCREFQSNITNATLKCNLGGVCTSLSNEKFSFQECLDLLRKPVLESTEAWMKAGCEKESSDSKICIEVFDIEFLMHHPKCYQQMSDQFAECTPDCKKVWKNMTEQFPHCSKTMEDVVLQNKKIGMTIGKKLIKVQQPDDGEDETLEFPPLMTFTELCKKDTVPVIETL